MRILASILILAMAGLPKGKPAKPAVPDRPLTQRETWWRDIEPLPEQVFRIDKTVNLYLATAKRYQGIENARSPGCPAPVIFVLHMRESTNSFSKHLHEGSSLKGRTRWVPVGRPKTGSPPFTWEESAVDALYVLKSYQRAEKWKNIDSMIDWIERFNGLGYRRPGRRSPYVVAGSNLQIPGKYVADHKFDGNAWDRQLGCLVVLKELSRRGHWSAPPY